MKQDPETLARAAHQAQRFQLAANGRRPGAAVAMKDTRFREEGQALADMLAALGFRAQG